MLTKIFLSLGAALTASLVFMACLPGNNQVVPDPLVEDPTMQQPTPDADLDGALVPTENIVELAQASGSFQTLLLAAGEAGLLDTLSTAELTLLAPTDAAFEALPEGTLEALMADPDELSAILSYHVIPGQVNSAELMALDEAETLQGGSIQVSSANGMLTIDGANVLQADVMATNGVIHVIDTVLMP